MSDVVRRRSVRDDFFDSIKKKVVDFGVDYAKKNFSFSKEEVARYVEGYVRERVERRLRVEIRKQVLKYVSFLFFILGMVFVVYFLIDFVVLGFGLPDVFTNLFFGVLLLFLYLVLLFLR